LLVAVHDETGRFVCGIRVDHAAKLHLSLSALHYFTLVGHNTYSPAFHTAEAADDALPVACLILLEIRIIYQPADDLAHLVRLFAGGGQYTIDFLFFQSRARSLYPVKARIFRFAQLVHDPADGLQARFVIRLLVIRYARYLTVGGCAAQRFVIYRFTYGRFDQVRSCQEYRAGTVYDHRLVAHNR